MDRSKLPMTGRCRCGQVGLRVTAPPLLTGACDCTGCQRMSASAVSLSVASPDDGFEVMAGEPVTGGLHGPEARHFHCPHCMSWMFTRVASPAGSFVNPRPTMLDDATWYRSSRAAPARSCPGPRRPRSLRSRNSRRWRPMRI